MGKLHDKGWLIPAAMRKILNNDVVSDEATLDNIRTYCILIVIHIHTVIICRHVCRNKDLLSRQILICYANS